MLTRRRKKFIKEYALSENATQSAIKAGYTERTAHSTGWRLIQKDYIKELIEQEKINLCEKYKINKDILLQKLVKLEDTTNNDNVKTRCIELQARISGNLDDNKQINVVNVATNTDIDRLHRLYDRVKGLGASPDIGYAGNVPAKPSNSVVVPKDKEV